jgi:predicted aldo/keto reductase-like oxidoreductase
MERRTFLKQAAATAVAGRAGTTSALPVRALGNTGLKVPLLAYGGAALPKVWLNPLSREDRVALVRYAFDRGLRYFDTAGNYMESQSILGEALRDKRNEITLVTKVEATEPGAVRAAVEKSLRELQTDHVDVLLMHGTPGIEQMTVLQAMKVREAVEKVRGERMTRFVGFSAHGYFDKAADLIDSGAFDVFMASYGYVPRGYNQVWSPRMLGVRNACIEKAHARGMGIVAMKVMGAGMLGAWSGDVVPGYDKAKLGKLPGAAIRWTLQDERVHLLNIGMRLKEEIDANLRVLTGDVKFTTEDRMLLAEFSAKLWKSEAIKKLRVEA